MLCGLSLSPRRPKHNFVPASNKSEYIESSVVLQQKMPMKILCVYSTVPVYFISTHITPTRIANCRWVIIAQWTSEPNQQAFSLRRWPSVARACSSAPLSRSRWLSMGHLKRYCLLNYCIATFLTIILSAPRYGRQKFFPQANINHK